MSRVKFIHQRLARVWPASVGWLALLLAPVAPALDVEIGSASAIHLGAGVAHAQPAQTTASGRSGSAGATAAPTAPAPRPLDTDPDERRAVRGCAVGEDCRGQALAGLREFELEAFGAAPGVSGASSGTAEDPWLEDSAPSARQRPAGSGRRAGRPVAPTDLRPDLPWLAKLDMPDLPVRWHERVIQYLEFYKDDPRGRNIMRGWLRRQARYRDMIISRLRRAGLPEDLLYVAMIESSYDPRTRSPVGATGLWQFMNAGGRIYGLWIDRWIDERQDPVRSTDAAILYFKDLYQRFGDWHLAMAAYNAGFGAVLRGVTRYNTNDFWELSDYENGLPWGTVLYVPKALAAAIVGRNRAFFGFDDLDEPTPLAWDEVTVPKSVPLRTVARAAGVSVEAVEELNPQLRKNRTPPTIQGYVLRVPRGTGQLFAVRFGQLRKDWDRYDTYVVRHGERFEDIATIHGIARRKLADLNGVEEEADVRGGTVLVVPRVSAEEKQKNRARAAEELYASGSPPAQEDEAMLVAVPDKDLVLPGTRRVFYRVVAGDTSSGVAAAFGVSRDDLGRWNDLAEGATLHPRMILQVFVAEGWDGTATDGAPVAMLDPARLLVVTRGSPEHVAIIEQRMGRERMIYTPERRESFAEIGRKFGLTDHDLARINRRPHDTVIAPGEEVIVYKVVDRGRSDRAADQAKAKRRQDRRKRSDKDDGDKAQDDGDKDSKAQDGGDKDSKDSKDSKDDGKDKGARDSKDAGKRSIGASPGA